MSSGTSAGRPYSTSHAYRRLVKGFDNEPPALAES